MLHALIVDDNEENLYLLNALLTGSGYMVTTAKNGIEALNEASKSPPDLIISDILMPVMDGFSLCRAWKQDSRLKSIPFVFYTATYTDTRDEQFALSIGADKFIIKPKEPKEFLHLVEEVLKNVSAGKSSSKLDKQTPETSYLKQYNATLIHKLEDKLVQIDKANQELEQKDAFNRDVLNSMAERVSVIDESGTILVSNQNWADHASACQSDLFFHLTAGDNIIAFIQSQVLLGNGIQEKILGKIKAVLDRSLSDYETDFSCFIGDKEHTFFCRVTPMQNSRGAVITYNDITGRKLLERQLRSALNDKEALTRELFHRTKNNMQVISSMIELEMGFAESEETKEVLRRTGSRIKSLSLVHQQLYRGQNLSKIDLREYLTECANAVVETYESDKDRIKLVIDVDREMILFDIALPCGLVVNELITNAIRHAFPDNRHGEIRLQLHRKESGEIRLEVRDNGVGVAPDFDFEKCQTLGFRLIKTLVRRQLRGKFEFKGDGGVCCCVTFREELYSERV